MERDFFVKRVLDVNKLNGFFMDDHTADLLYDQFYDMEYEELDKVLQILLENGEKITYKSIKSNRIKKRTEEKKNEPIIEVRTDCKKDCKECDGKGFGCAKLNEIGFEYIGRIGKGLIDYKKAMEELHEMFPKMGFDKKIGTPTGTIIDANGEHITVYKYD